MGCRLPREVAEVGKAIHKPLQVYANSWTEHVFLGALSAWAGVTAVTSRCACAREGPVDLG